MEPTRAFIHGLESSGRGTKGTFFRKRCPGMIIEDYSGPFHARMDKLEMVLAGKDNLILAGSSFGGLMAAVFACLHEERINKLVLLAPALHLEFYRPYRDKKLHIPITIFHGLHDNIVPLEDVRIIADRLYMNHEFNAVEDDHVLHDTFAALNWNALLDLKA